MSDKVTLEAEVKSNIKQVSKETKDLTNNFGAFGITIGSVKQKFAEMGTIVLNGLKQIKLQAKLAGIGFKQMFSGQIIKGAKTLFTVIKTGIAATGVGLLLVAFGSLISFFTKTKKGAELLEVVFTAIGTAINVIVDRVSKFGGAIVKLFKGDAKGALQDVKGAFTGIGDEIRKDTNEAIRLKRAFQELRDEERKLNVETAQRRTEIEQLKLIAEDVTKSESVRLKAAKDAFAIENKLLEDRLANARQAVNIQKEQNALNNSMDADLDALAEKQINLANIEGESTTKQIELNNKINAIQAEGAAKRLAALDALKAADKERMGEVTKMARVQVDLSDKIAKADNYQLDRFLRNSKKKKKLTEEEVDARLTAFGSLAGALSALAGDNKELAIAEAIISTYQGANKAFAQGGVTGFVSAAAIIASGLSNVKKIMEQDVGGGGGGGGAPSAGGAPPAPEMMSGSFELSGGVKPDPVQAYVVSDDVTNNQDKLAAIRRRATI